MEVSACNPPPLELRVGQPRQLGVENGRCASLTIGGDPVAGLPADIPYDAADVINRPICAVSRIPLARLQSHRRTPSLKVWIGRQS
jgi:hypothetical protein